MKIWNNPELEELDVMLTASGTEESDYESSDTDVATTFCFFPWWDNDCNKPTTPTCTTKPSCTDPSGEPGSGDYPIPGES